MPTIGSLCTGYGGLDLAASQLIEDAHLAWTSEIDPDANTVLETRFPDVPNIGDLREATPEPADIITAGFPCQPLSTAGKRKGTDDDRWIWDDIEALIRRMDPPPRLLLLENVPGLLTANSGNAMARVVEGLASSGFVGRYRLLRASDVGACHQRRRIFIVAAHTERLRDGPERRARRGDERGRDQPRGAPLPSRAEVAHPADAPPGGGDARLLPTPNAWDGARGPDYARQRDRAATGSGGDDLTTTVAKLLPTPQARDEKEWTDSRATPDTIGRPRSEGGAGTLVDLPQLLRWGHYADAINRHIEATGQLPPDPADEARRLAPAFVEWMMMLPAGWVTDVDIPRTAQLRILGNGVVPAQAAAAYAELLP